MAVWDGAADQARRQNTADTVKNTEGINAMDSTYHRFTELFQQLGLAADARSIQDFLLRHSPLHSSIRLESAPFWSQAQSALLRDEILLDADWAEVVDQLNTALRGSKGK